VGNKQKKIDISIPKLDIFIHKVYINVARKVYTNVYLFEKNINPLQVQKNNRELEAIIQECIMNAIRESIPTESIIRAYMDESIEQEEEVIIENIEDPVVENEKKIQDMKMGENMGGANSEKTDPITPEENIPSMVPVIKDIDNENVITRLTFNDMDSILDESNSVKSVDAPKSIERLEEISTNRAFQRKLEEEESSEDEDDKIKIHTDMIDLSGFDILDEKPGILTEDFMLDGIEELP
jgi:hypothetical protein